MEGTFIKGNEKIEEINLDTIKQIRDKLSGDLVERKGCIMLPSMKGFDLYEISEANLKSYLAIEYMQRGNKIEDELPNMQQMLKGSYKSKDGSIKPCIVVNHGYSPMWVAPINDLP